MRVMAIDFGERRIGVALSDELCLTAQPFCVIERGERESDLREIRRLVEEYGVDRIVVGLPLRTDGKHGPEAEAAERFARRLGSTLNVPVELFDERFTSAAAKRSLIEGGVRRHRRKRMVDMTAACLILESYIRYIARES